MSAVNSAQREGNGRSSVWKIDGIVETLRALRDASLEARHRVHRPTKLPRRHVLATIVENLNTVLFPNRLGSRELTTVTVDYFVGHTLDTTLSELDDEVWRELHFASHDEKDADEQRGQATRIVRAFASQLPEIRALLETDIRAAFEGNPTAGDSDEVLACDPGFTAIVYHRLAHALYTLGAPLVARIIAEIAHTLTGIHIHPGARIGASFSIDYGMGVTIGETAVIGQRVRIYQAVTLGARRSLPGQKVSGPVHPIVEDDVTLYAGASLLGRITIGRGSTIGGNVWLTQDVAPRSNISQAPLRNEDFEAGSGI